ncbi:MAG: MFS transporter, partial [Acidimicrobiia bacterium]|nr:MFS transporter [Acidimicrobiia bacterium]
RRSDADGSDGSDGSDGDYEVVERFDYALAVPLWKFLLARPVRRALRVPPRDGMPWWSPPDRLDARAARVIALLCSLSVLAGYLGSLLSQTITFATDEYGASNDAEGIVLAATRTGIVISIVMTTLADRRGRRPLLLRSGTLACLVAALTALAPALWVYGTTQTVARGLSTALALLIGVVAAEETPARSRAYVISVLALCAGLGSGMVVWFLPIADVGPRAWRLLFLAPLLGLVLVAAVARSLPETRRFEVAAPLPRRRLAPRRLVLLGTTVFFAALLAAPASNFQNDFLRDDRGFSAAQVSLFQLSVNTPIGLGVLIGGRLADTRGRRVVGATAFLIGSFAVAARYSTSGLAMWLAAIIGAVVGAAAIPALGVYSFELFGTSRRAQSNGYLSVIGVMGSVVGLLFVGFASDRIGFDTTFQLLLIAPVIVAIVILAFYPETAGQELEDINPEDRRGEVSDRAVGTTGGQSTVGESEK